MTWEVQILKKTRLGVYENCLALIDAYAPLAPWWERIMLLTFAYLGPPLGGLLGGDTKTLWRQANEIVADVFAASALPPHEIAKALRQYAKLKRSEDHRLTSERAREIIYNQSFYPLVTHFTLAFQPSAFARMRFVRRAVQSLTTSHAIVADLGCGSGAMLCEVLKQRPHWIGYGLDISQAAVDYSRCLASHKGVSERASFQTGCLNDLPFASHSLDVVIASEVVEHLAEPERVFRELSRVLAPNGLVLITMPVESHSPAHMHTLNSPEELRALMDRAGLKVLSLEVKWHVSYGDDRRHVFAVAQNASTKFRTEKPPYNLLLPQISSAASSGMLSS